MISLKRQRSINMKETITIQPIYNIGVQFNKLRFSNKTLKIDSHTVSIYQVSSVQLVTDKKLGAFNKA